VSTEEPDSTVTSRAEALAPDQWRTLSVVLASSISFAWLLLAAAVLAHDIFVTNDSLSNYAHVWYVAERLWHGHGIPYSMPVIGHGQALAFPYAFIPWTTAALLRPLLGDWVVTLWLVLGLAGLLAATWYAFPELRRPWAAALLFAAVAFWRRRHAGAAVALAGLAQATHPPVIMPLALLILAVALVRDPVGRRRTLIAYAGSVAIALPAIYMVFASPVVEDTTFATQLANLLGTVGWRLVVVALPFVLVWQRPWLRGPPAFAAACLLAALVYAMVPLRHDDFAWGALTREPDTVVRDFTGTPDFAPGATYRILRAHDGKVGMYDLIRAGARIDSEFFPESINRRSWSNATAYAAFLAARNVDYVLIFPNYDSTWRTNEHALLRQIASAGCAGAEAACVSLVSHTDEYELYSIARR
jgi:hypothetical protein